MRSAKLATCLLSLLVILAFSFSLIALTPIDSYAKKKVKIQFEAGWCPKLKNGSAVKTTAKVASRMLSKFKKVHSFAGTNLSVITDCNITDYDEIIKVVAGTNSRGPGIAGYEPPCNKTGYVYGGAFGKAGFPNSSSLGRGMGNIGAHEHAHHWRVAHADAKTKNIMQSKFTVGRAASCNLTFDATARGKFQTYMKTSVKTKADPGGSATVDPARIVVAVYGVREEVLPDSVFYSDPYTEGITVTFSGNFASFDFGWINPHGDFISQIAEGRPTGRLMLYGAERVNFAIRDVFSEEVFTVGAGQGTLSYLLPEYTGDFAEMPSLPASARYYGGVEINFPVQGYTAVLTANSPPDGFVSWEEIVPEQPGLRMVGVIALLGVLVIIAIWRLRVRLAARAS